MNDEAAAVVLALATENAELRAQLVEAQELLVELARSVSDEEAPALTALDLQILMEDDAC